QRTQGTCVQSREKNAEQTESKIAAASGSTHKGPPEEKGVSEEACVLQRMGHLTVQRGLEQCGDVPEPNCNALRHEGECGGCQGVDQPAHNWMSQHPNQWGPPGSRESAQQLRKRPGPDQEGARCG